MDLKPFHTGRFLYMRLFAPSLHRFKNGGKSSLHGDDKVETDGFIIIIQSESLQQRPIPNDSMDCAFTAILKRKKVTFCQNKRCEASHGIKSIVSSCKKLHTFNFG